jgi:hypothetical protein
VLISHPAGIKLAGVICGMQASPVKAPAEAPVTSTTLLPAETETSATTEVEESIMGEAADLAEGGMTTPEVVVARAPTPDGYFGREKVTPFMERHLRKLQVRTFRSHWTLQMRRNMVSCGTFGF